MKRNLLTVAVLASVLASVAAAAEPDFVVKRRDPNKVIDKSSARFLATTPMAMPKVSPSLLRAALAARGEKARPTVASVSTDSHPPTLSVGRSLERRLLSESDLAKRLSVRNLGETFDKVVGDAELHFSSSRLIPKTADKVFPHLPVGLLLFETPDGTGFCSASVIAKRVIVTAGHCVHNGEGTGDPDNFFDDFVFVPAYRDGVAPKGIWEYELVVVTGGWANSGGDVPANDDYAVLTFFDEDGKKLGNVTGNLGTSTGKISPNDVTIFGYSVNLDDAERLHRVQSGQSVDFDNNTAVYGSDMENGSSGGPWVQNFGEKSTGQTLGNSGRNRVVSVTSFFFPADSGDPEVGAQGGSEFDSTFSNIFNQACNDRSGNC